MVQRSGTIAKGQAKFRSHTWRTYDALRVQPEASGDVALRKLRVSLIAQLGRRASRLGVTRLRAIADPAGDLASGEEGRLASKWVTLGKYVPLLPDTDQVLRHSNLLLKSARTLDLRDGPVNARSVCEGRQNLGPRVLRERAGLGILHGNVDLDPSERFLLSFLVCLTKFSSLDFCCVTSGSDKFFRKAPNRRFWSASIGRFSQKWSLQVSLGKDYRDFADRGDSQFLTSAHGPDASEWPQQVQLAEAKFVFCVCICIKCLSGHFIALLSLLPKQCRNHNRVMAEDMDKYSIWSYTRATNDSSETNAYWNFLMTGV